MTLLSSILYQFQGRKKILKSEEVEGKEKVLQLYSCQSLVGGYRPSLQLPYLQPLVPAALNISYTPTQCIK